MRPGVERDVWMEQRQGGTMEGYGKRVLIADDEESVRQLVAAVLAAETDTRKVHESLTVEIRKALNEFADGRNR